jgi:hypothetical protein
VDETVPCKTCGKLTGMIHTKLCNGCWEVETRLERYVQSSKGLEFVKCLVAKVTEGANG